MISFFHKEEEHELEEDMKKIQEQRISEAWQSIVTSLISS